MAFGNIILGPIVGTATYTGPSSLNSYADFTLTGTVAATTPGFYRGFAYAIVSSQPDATAPYSFDTPGYNQRRVGQLTSLDHDMFSAAYPNHEPVEESSSVQPVIAHSFISTGGTTHMFRGMFSAIAYDTFHAGDQMRFRINLTSYASPLDWWSVNVHSCQYPSFVLNGFTGLLSSGTGTTIVQNPSLFGNHWRGLVMTSLTSLDTSLAITSVVIPSVLTDTQAGALTRTGVFRSVYSGYPLYPTDVTGGTMTITKNVSSNTSYFLGTYKDNTSFVGPDYRESLSFNYHH